MIFIYLSGGVSHVDSFDPKPKLAEYQRDGKTGDEQSQDCSARRGQFKPRGKCGIEVTDLFPHIARMRGRPLRDPLACAAITTITSRPRSASTPAR